ncbi:MAG: ROK family protein [Mycobacterium leprae]
MKPTIRFSDMSTGNRAAVLRLIREHGPVSRAALARTTGFTAPSISRIADDLTGWDLICEEAGVAEAGPGRPPTLLRFDGERQYAISASLFPDRQEVGLVDLTGQTLAQAAAKTGRATPAEAFDVLLQLVEEVRRQAPDAKRVRGVGLTVPGLVDSRRSVIRHSPPHGWQDVSVAGLLGSRIDLPVVVENWVSARALAERYFGGAKTVADFVYVHVSAGIGAAIMSGGRLREGALYTSAEFGHLPLTMDGPLCRCGKRGCVEAYASLSILPLYAGMEGVDPESVLVAAQEGNPAARTAVERAMRYLALGLTGLIHLLNPSQIFLDGWPVAAGDLAMEPLRTAVKGRVLEGLGEAVTLLPTALGRNPHLGGAALILDEVLNLHI